MPNTPSDHCLLVYGPAGVGKTRLLKEFRQKFANATFPVVSAHIDVSLDDVGSDRFIQTLVHRVETRWPELEPFVVAFREMGSNLETEDESEAEGEGEARNPFEGFLDGLDDYFLQSKEWDSKPELEDLKLCFIIDGLDRCSDQTLQFLTCLKREMMNDARFAQRHFFIFSGVQKSACEEQIQLISAARAVVEPVLVPPFSLPESSILLEQLGVDGSKYDLIHKESGGSPELLIQIAEKYRKVAPQDAAKMELAEALLRSIDQEQQEWIKIASLLSVCDTEGLGLFLSKEQQLRATKWFQLGVVSCIDIAGDFPKVKEPEKEALMAYMEQENYGKLSKRLNRIEQLESIRRVVPKIEHRRLLSILQEFIYFDRDLLVYLFGEKQANICLNLVETKTVFFTAVEGGYQLSRQAGIVMGLYNQLYPLQNLAETRKKVKVYWAKKVTSYQQAIADAEEQIDGNETIQKEVKSSIEDLDQKIAKISHVLSRMNQENRRMIVQVRRSGISYLGVVLQLSGIVALYFGILFKDEIVMPVLFGAGVLISLGFVFSLKKHGNVRIRQREVIYHSRKRAETIKESERLKSAKLQLATRRDQCKNQLRDCREKIAQLRFLMKRPYMKV